MITAIILGSMTGIVFLYLFDHERTFAIKKVLLPILIGGSVGVAVLFLHASDCADVYIEMQDRTVNIGERCIYRNNDGVTIRTTFTIRPEYEAAYAHAVKPPDTEYRHCGKPDARHDTCIYYTTPERDLDIIDPKAVASKP